MYATRKAGIVRFTRTMALELAEHGIRVNAIAPDMTQTPAPRSYTVERYPTSFRSPPGRWKREFASTSRLGGQAWSTNAATSRRSWRRRLSGYVTGACIPIERVPPGGWLRLVGGGWNLYGVGGNKWRPELIDGWTRVGRCWPRMQALLRFHGNRPWVANGPFDA